MTPDEYTSAAALERHAEDIADAIAELVPSPGTVEQCEEGRILHTSCDVSIDKKGNHEWDGLDTRDVIDAISRILKHRQ